MKDTIRTTDIKRQMKLKKSIVKMLCALGEEIDQCIGTLANITDKLSTKEEEEFGGSFEDLQGYLESAQEKVNETDSFGTRLKRRQSHKMYWYDRLRLPLRCSTGSRARGRRALDPQPTPMNIGSQR